MYHVEHVGLERDFFINIGEGYQMAKIGSEYVTLAEYIDGNSGFMKTENVLNVVISYLPI